MSYSKLSAYGQIYQGDRLVIVDGQGKAMRRVARDVLNAGTDKEEVIINLSKNKYFIVSMYLKGESWAKAIAYEPVLTRDNALQKGLE